MFCDSSLYCILILIGVINLIDICCMYLYEVYQLKLIKLDVVKII